jgi:tartrate/fumarate subfamily iron-sulfur-dependent hydro-lyase alpha chain
LKYQVGDFKVVIELVTTDKGVGMIKQHDIEALMYEAMRLAATRMPPDVKVALEEALEEESEAIAKAHLVSCLKNAEMSAAGQGLVCGDTGYPLYFVKIGCDAHIEGGVPGIFRAAEAATRRATAECYLRPTMVDPVSRDNPGDNIGPGMPKVELVFTDSPGGLDVIAAPKGGGSEIFGTFYRMLFPSDGLAGIKKFVIECIKDSCYAGKICPPAIVGVGIGGTADLSMKLAKEAALLHPVGTQNADPALAELEQELLEASRRLGIGPMGGIGKTCVLGLRVSGAVTHTAALPVAFNAQCLVGRRWRGRIDGTGTVSYSGDISGWMER